MTRLAIIGLFMIFSLTARSQTYKFLTTSFSVMEKNERGNWGSWSEAQPASIVITLDTNKNRIVVYSQEIQLYRIMDYLPEEENESDLVYPFACMDEEGEPFNISIITRKTQNNRKQLYIAHRDVLLVYNIINFPEK